MSQEILWETAILVAELAPGAVTSVRVSNCDIAIYNVGGEYFATDNVCTHAFALLHEGYLSGDIIECPLHGGCFNVRTGEGLGAPIIHNLKTFPTRVVGDKVQIAVIDGTSA